MRVIVRYADESKFDGEWEVAPDFEIQTISYVDPNGMAILRHQGDYYRLEDSEIVPHAYHAVVFAAYQAEFKPNRHPELELIDWATENGFKKGSMIGSEKWKRIYSMGTADRDSLRPPRGQ